MIYEDVSRLVEEIRLTWHRTVTATDVIHGGSPVSVPMRAVLEYVRRHGPRTVSAMARARSVSRQHVQALVNELLELELVERLDNPDHARAPMIGLTPAGASCIDGMQARERDLLEPVLEDLEAVSGERVRAAADVVRAVGEAMMAVGR